MNNNLNNDHKNDELLDMLTELKLEDRHIDEALGNDPESAGGMKIYAGNTKRSPMRIVAPIAACLAVFAAAGIIFANKSTNRPNVCPAAQGSGEIVDEASVPDTDTDTDNNSEDSSFEDDINVAALTDFEFVEKCKELVARENGFVSPGDVEWQESRNDIDFDGEDELLLLPTIDQFVIDGVGVRVFKRTPDEIRDLGAFATELKLIFLDSRYHYYDENARKYYYYNFYETNESCVETIYEVSLDEETGKLREQPYLRFATTYPEDENSDTPFSDTAYRYGEEISTEEIFEEWLAMPDMPAINGLYGGMDMKIAVEALIEKHNIPVSDYNELSRAVGAPDINGDGRDDVIITFEGCEQLPGIYVFAHDNGIKLIGEFDANGESIDSIPRKFTDGGDSFYLYRTRKYEKRTVDDGSEWETEKYEVHKIIVNADGSLGEEVIVSRGAEFAADGSVVSTNQINGKDVTSKEAEEEWNRITLNLEV